MGAPGGSQAAATPEGSSGLGAPSGLQPEPNGTYPAGIPTVSTLQENLPEFELPEMFSVRRPKNFIAGLSSGAKSFLKGTLSGVVGLIAAPIVGSMAAPVRASPCPAPRPRARGDGAPRGGGGCCRPHGLVAVAGCCRALHLLHLLQLLRPNLQCCKCCNCCASLHNNLKWSYSS